MSNFKTPGVYIREISTLPASIAAVETAIPAFIGYTAIAEKDGESLNLVPTRISSMLEYESYFGGPNNESIVIEVTDTYDGQDAQPAVMIDRKVTVSPPASSLITKCIQHEALFRQWRGLVYHICRKLSQSSRSDQTHHQQVYLEVCLNWKVDEPTHCVPGLYGYGCLCRCL